MSAFYFALVAGALCFTAVGWLARGAWENDRRANARGGYLKTYPQVENWCCPDRGGVVVMPMDLAPLPGDPGPGGPPPSHAALAQFADAMDRVAGVKK